MEYDTYQKDLINEPSLKDCRDGHSSDNPIPTSVSAVVTHLWDVLLAGNRFGIVSKGGLEMPGYVPMLSVGVAIIVGAGIIYAGLQALANPIGKQERMPSLEW